MKCPKCRSEIEDNSAFCKNCGHQQTEGKSMESRHQDRKIAIIMISCIGVLAILAAVYISSTKNVSEVTVNEQSKSEETNALSKGPASYVKYAGAEKEGTEGFIVRLRLANAQGEYTIGDGKLEVWLTQKRDDWSGRSMREWSVTLFHHTFDVSSKEFRIDDDGDSFWRSDRVTFDKLIEQPWNLEERINTLAQPFGGKTKVLFTKASGESLEGESNDVPWQ